MEAFMIVAVITILTGGSSAAEDKKHHIMHFYKCIACHDNAGVMALYKKCAEFMPDKCKKISEDCKNQILSGMDKEEQKEAMCNDYNEVNEQMYYCVWHDKDKLNLNTAEEEAQLEEFIECAEKLNTEYCESQ